MNRAAAVRGVAAQLVLWAGVSLSGPVPLGAQSTSGAQSPVVTFSTPGPKTVTLTVCNLGGCDTVTRTVTVLSPEPAVTSASVGPSTAEVGQLVSLSGSGTGRAPLTYTWRVLLGGTLIREIPGASGWWNTSGLAPGVYSVVLRIANASGVAESVPAAVAVVAPQGTNFHTVTPCRLLDTRSGAPLASGVARGVNLAGSCGVPAGARSVAVNVTVLSPTGQGKVVLYPGNYPVPGTSTINFPPGATLANNAVLPLATNGAGTLAMLATLADHGSVDLLIDVSGYFAP